jgi:hypothetical protein
MSKSIQIAATVVMIAGVFGAGCLEWLVGAPCTPETDEGVFNKDLADTTYLVETRSVQCKTSICLTKIKLNEGEISEEAESDFEKYKNSQTKYSFCSCRCEDKDGNKFDRNNDKFDDLCECPPSTNCIKVLGDNIEAAPDKIKGSYCIPKCIDEGCQEVRHTRDGNLIRQKCVPSSDSEEPWKWKCQF